MIYIYCRVSTDSQNETSFEVQEEVVRSKLNTIDPVEVIREVGSGKDTENRPLFLNMMNNLKQGDKVAIYDQSRLSRNTEVALFLLNEINKRGASLIIDGKVIDSANPQDKMLYTIQSSFSTYQRELQIQKSREGLKKKYLNGDAVFTGKLFGYEVIRKGKNVVATIIEEEAEVLRFIYTEYNKGSSLKAIEEKLASIRLTRPFIFNVMNIRCLLKRPLYMGYYSTETNTQEHNSKYKTKEEFSKLLVKSNIYPPIISEELWWSVFSNYRSCKRPHAVSYENRWTFNTLSGLIKCPGCCKGISFHNRYRKESGNYCKEYILQAHTIDCPSKKRTAWNNVWLENVFITMFVLTFKEGSEVGRFFEETRFNLNKDIEGLRGQLNSDDAELKKIDKSINNIVDAIAEGIIDNDNAKVKMKSLNSNKERIFQHKGLVEEEIRNLSRDVEDYIETSANDILLKYDTSKDARRGLYFKYIKEAFDYYDYFIVKFVNGKMFKVERPKRYNYGIKPATIEVSYNGVLQYKFTFYSSPYRIEIVPLREKDVFIKYVNDRRRELESIVNDYLSHTSYPS